MSTTTTFGTLLSAIVQAVKNDAIKTELPILTTFFQSLENNSSQENVVAQLAALEVSVLASGPNVEQAIVKDIATLLQQETATLAASATATAPTAS